jgi:hypothetical protein
MRKMQLIAEILAGHALWDPGTAELVTRMTIYQTSSARS